MEVAIIFLIKHYNISDAERVPIVKAWLRREGPQLIQTLKQMEQFINGINDDVMTKKKIKELRTQKCKQSHNQPSSTVQTELRHRDQRKHCSRI